MADGKESHGHINYWHEVDLKRSAGCITGTAKINEKLFRSMPHQRTTMEKKAGGYSVIN